REHAAAHRARRARPRVQHARPGAVQEAARRRLRGVERQTRIALLEIAGGKYRLPNIEADLQVRLDAALTRTRYGRRSRSPAPCSSFSSALSIREPATPTRTMTTTTMRATVTGSGMQPLCDAARTCWSRAP